MFFLTRYKPQDVQQNGQWLFSLFVICEKYGCATTFKDYFELHLLRIVPRTLAISSKCVVVAAYVRDRELFHSFSALIVSGSRAALCRHFDGDVASRMPPLLLGTISIDVTPTFH